MSRRVLVAGIGNVFLGDDGFGVEVVRRLSGRKLPEGVEVADFGIRSLDLAYALREDYDLVILVDALPRGGAPGTVYLLEPEVGASDPLTLETHGMDPVSVIRLALTLGAPARCTLVVGCEPDVVLGSEDYDEMAMELNEPVRAAVEEAADLVVSLLESSEGETGEPGGTPGCSEKGR